MKKISKMSTLPPTGKISADAHGLDYNWQAYTVAPHWKNFCGRPWLGLQLASIHCHEINLHMLNPDTTPASKITTY